jgi:hypothetical protein
MSAATERLTRGQFGDIGRDPPGLVARSSLAADRRLTASPLRPPGALPAHQGFSPSPSIRLGPRAIWRSQPLRHDAFAAEHAGVSEQDSAVAFKVLIEHDAMMPAP